LRHEPAVLVLSRQPLPTLDRKKYAPASGVARGAYVLADASGEDPEVILIASGSEVSLAVEAHEKLIAGGIRSHVVSMPPGTSSNIRRRNIGIASCRRTSNCVLVEQADGLHHRNENVWHIGTTERTPEKVRLRA